MSTWAGHSAAQALHPRHSSRASCRPSSASPAGSRPSRAARRIAARPRVECRSSPSAWKLGHMLPDRARQAPLELHASPARARPPSVAKSRAVRRGRRGGDAARRSPASRGSGRVSTPGLSSRSGSSSSLRRPKAAIVSGGYIRGSSSPRTRPSPCSPDSEPPFAATRSATPSAIRRTLATAPGRRRSISGRMCRQPTLACPYQMAGAPSSASRRRTSRAKPASRSGGTAGSSMNGRGRGSPPGPGARAGPQGAGDARAAHRPHRLLGGRVRDHAGAGDGLQPLAHRVGCPAVLHDQDRRGVAGGVQQGTVGRRPVGRVQQRVVHELDRRGARGEQPHHRLQGLIDRAEGHQRQPPRGGAGDQRQLRPPGHGQRPLRAAQQARPVGVLAPQGLEGVPRHPADQRGRPRRRGEGPRGLERRRGGRPPAQGGPRAVGQRHRERAHVVGRQPVDHRAGPGRVIGDHPAEGRPVGGGDVGPEHQPVGRGGGVEVVQHDARADAGDPGAGVDLDRREGGAVDHQTGSHGLARQAGAGPPHRERDAVGAAGRHGRVQVVGAGRPEGGDGPAPVQARVRRVEVAGGGVVANLPARLGPELRDQSGRVHERDGTVWRRPCEGAPAEGRPPCGSGCLC